MNRLTSPLMIWRSTHAIPTKVGPKTWVPFPRRTTVTSTATAAPIKQGK